MTDDPEDMARSAAFVEVLAFHQWERLGLRYTLADVEPPTAEATERACALWRAAGLHAN